MIDGAPGRSGNDPVALRRYPRHRARCRPVDAAGAPVGLSAARRPDRAPPRRPRSARDRDAGGDRARGAAYAPHRRGARSCLCAAALRARPPVRARHVGGRGAGPAHRDARPRRVACAAGRTCAARARGAAPSPRSWQRSRTRARGVRRRRLRAGGRAGRCQARASHDAGRARTRAGRNGRARRRA